jgi:hypothetical protein
MQILLIIGIFSRILKYTINYDDFIPLDTIQLLWFEIYIEFSLYLFIVRLILNDIFNLKNFEFKF